MRQQSRYRSQHAHRRDALAAERCAPRGDEQIPAADAGMSDAPFGASCASRTLVRSTRVAVLLLLCACNRSPTEGTPVPPPPTAREGQIQLCLPLKQAEDAATPPTRAQAVAFAEAFIRAAGYTDSPATCLASEPLFGRDLAQRHRQLQAKAVATQRNPRGWTVVFLYNQQWLAQLDVSLDGPSIGRAVLIDDQTGRATVAHQDALVDGFDRLAP